LIELQDSLDQVANVETRMLILECLNRHKEPQVVDVCVWAVGWLKVEV
jgi:hypothetical protein